MGDAFFGSMKAAAAAAAAAMMTPPDPGGARGDDADSDLGCGVYAAR
jgi:hypothetical protein